MQPWRVYGDEPGGATASTSHASGVPPSFWPAQYSTSAGARADASADAAAASGGAGSRGGGAGAWSVSQGVRLQPVYSLPASATLSEDEDGEAERRAGPVTQQGGAGESAPTPARNVSSSAPGSRKASATIPEIASDAALAELRCRIREDSLALRQARGNALRGVGNLSGLTRVFAQFVAETDEQWQHLGSLRKELEELSVTLTTLQAKRHQTSAEAEEEERRVLDARRLRSSLRKGLHDAQKRVDGAGHRSRAALQQLHKLLNQAAQFVAAEEEGPASGPPGALEPDAGTPGGGCTDFEDNWSDRYSVADEAMGAPPQPLGPLGQLAAWARSVLSMRIVVGLGEVSFTLSPGPRRRRKRGARPRPPRPALREILEASDAASDEGGPADASVTPVPTPHAAPPLPPPASTSVVEGLPSPRLSPRMGSHGQHLSVQEMSRRLAAQHSRALEGGVRPALKLGDIKASGPSGATNRFKNLVNQASLVPTPTRAAPPPPQQQHGQARDGGWPHGGSPSWPVTPLSPQNSAERV